MDAAEIATVSKDATNPLILKIHIVYILISSEKTNKLLSFRLGEDSRTGKRRAPLSEMKPMDLFIVSEFAKHAHAKPKGVKLS